jgi:hypothetical protein
MARRGQANAPVRTLCNEHDRLDALLKNCMAARATYPEGHRERLMIEIDIEKLKTRLMATCLDFFQIKQKS